VLLFTLEDEPEDLPVGLAGVVTLMHMFVPAYPDKKIGRPHVSNLLRIMSAVGAFRPDVIHVTNDALSNTFALVGLLRGVPVVGSFHTDLQDLLASHKAHLIQALLTWLKERVDFLLLDSCGTTSVSFLGKLALQGIQCEYVIKTAVNKDVFNPKRRSEALRREMTFGGEDAFLCVYVGRLSKEKRLDVVVAALRDLPRAYLAIVGDGPSAAAYAALHGAHNRVYCRPGFKTHEELAQVYASSDLHVSASEFETLGNTVLEAHSCGVPVVVPKTQGFMDTVTDGTDGFFFVPGDSRSAAEYVLSACNVFSHTTSLQPTVHSLT
jgi:phosphatidylinositol alpha 1,6-mannosyltransferase